MGTGTARREWGIALLLGTGHGSQHFFRSLVPPLIPVLATDLSLPLWQLGLLVSLYSLFSGLGQTPFGILSDRYDRRYLLPGGLGVLAFGFGSFGLAPTLGPSLPTVTLSGTTFSGPYLLMCAAMAVGGIGASVTHPTGYPLISQNVSDARKGRALGIWGSASKLGDAVSPAVVGAGIIVVAWPNILLFCGALGIAYAVLLWVALGHASVDTVPPVEPSADDSTTDATDHPNEAASGHDRRIYVYPILVVLLFFLARSVATRGVNTFVPTFITDVYGYSLTVLGVHLGPASLASFYFSALLVVAAAVQLVAGSLTDKYDHRAVIVVFFTIAAVALWILSTVTLSPLALVAVLFVMGGSIWGSNPARDALISDISPADREGRTFGYLWTFTSIVGTAWPVAIGYLAERIGIQASFQFLAVSALVGAAVILLLFSRRVYVQPDRE